MTRSAYVLPPLVLLAVFLCLATATSCGKKTAPRPPELVLPDRIEGLEVEQKGDAVLLSWRRPERYVDGSRMPDLGGFRVERAEDGQDFVLLTTLPVTDRERFRKIRRLRYLDASARAGVRYRYRVLSYTLDDYVSEPSNVADIDVAHALPSPTAHP